MIKLYKINKVVTTCIMLLFFLQGCSSRYSSYNPWSKNNDANSNRRSPNDNPGNTTPAVTYPNKSNSQIVRQDFSQTNQAYQRYQANQPITLKEFDKTKRYPNLNIKSLNLAMDNSANTDIEKSIKVNSTSNLKEVIDHNKKQKSKKNNSETNTKKHITHKAKEEITTKTHKKPVAKETDIKKELEKKKAINAQSNNKAVTAKTTQAIIAPATTSSSNISANSASNSISSSTSTQTTTNSLSKNINTTATTKPAQPVASTTSTKITTSNNVSKNTNATVATKPAQPAATSTNSNSAPTPIKDSKVSIENMSQSDIENYLKEKFKNDSPRGFIDRLEDEDSSKNTPEANTKIIPPVAPISSVAPLTITNSATTSAPAVSKILATNNGTKLDKINSLLIECYFNIKNKVISTIYNQE